MAAVSLACGSRAAAEDAVQEALARAWERSERGEHIESLRAWVMKVAINLVRIDAVLTQTPRGKTRRSNFARLALHPALHDSVAA